MAGKFRNKRGQYVSENKLNTKIDTALKNVTQEYNIRLQALIRDKLIEELRHQIYASYTSTGDGSYTHKNLLPPNVYAVIEGDTIKVKLSDVSYKGTDSKGNIIDIPISEVYDYLKFGTTKTPKNEVYSYIGDDGKIHYAHYRPTPPHNFEARTREAINQFINDIKNNPEITLLPYLKKYKNKRTIE